MPIGFAPEVTYFKPSRKIASANTVAVVVPSPASSLVLLATSRTICAPIFSNLSERSISFGTVTPSLVIRGAPNDLSSSTLRPFGPSVTRTASLSISTPCNIRVRASTEKRTSLAAISSRSCNRQRPVCLCRLLGGRFLVEDAEDVGLLHDDQLFAIELDLAAGPFAEQHAVADLDIERL